MVGLRCPVRRSRSHRSGGAAYGEAMPFCGSGGDGVRKSEANWFTIQVRPGNEEKRAAALRASLDSDEYWVGFARKERNIKKGGVILKQMVTSFPGYVFVVSENSPETVRRELNPLLTAGSSAMRFVHYGNDANDVVLHDRDRELLCSLFNDDFIAAKLKVFAVGERIEIVDGLFGGATAVIKKVDRRRQSALVEFPWFDKKIQEWLDFERVDAECRELARE